MSPLEYRDSLRFEEARRLLSDGIPVSQIAEQVGFRDASYSSGYIKREQVSASELSMPFYAA